MSFLYSHHARDRRIEGDPVTLAEHGKMLGQSLTKTLIIEDQVMVAIRRQGGTELSDIKRRRRIGVGQPDDMLGLDEFARQCWRH